jgi:hypothetical protein
MGVAGGLGQEQIVDHHALHRRQPGRDVLRVGIGLRQILALHEQALEAALDGGIQHVGDAQARLGIDLAAPFLHQQGAHAVV